MLVPGQVPFPENPTCKQCLARPCQRLFTGAITPGKTIFVHRRDFMALPCYAPPLVKKESDAETAPALTDDIVAAPSNVEISNPRWEPITEAEAGGDPEIPLLGDKVKLLADVKNYPEGAPVSFDIYDVTGSTPLRIATVNSSNKGGTATAEWTVEDPQKQGEKLKLSFEAGAKSKYTEKADLPWKDLIRCDFVEMPDVLFHHNSAVPCLDEKRMLIGAITAAICYAKGNTEKELVLFGHSDTSGDPVYNYDLSQWRSEGIQALLENDCNAWLDIVDLASKVEDYQAILKTLKMSHGWNCDPGKIDNVAGEHTKAAVKAFQEQYNEKFSGNLKPDGIVGPKTWEAIFVVMRSLVEKAASDATGEQSFPSLNFGYNGKGVYACGESFPIVHSEKTNYVSGSNRRVEMMFWEKGKFTLKAPADRGAKISKDECPVYYSAAKRVPIPTSPATVKAIELELIYPLERTKKMLSTDANISRYWLGSVFGRAIPGEVFDAVADEIRNGGFTKPLCFAVDDAHEKLEGHSGSYDEDTETIYIRRTIVDSPSDTETLAVILCEEFGHHIENAIRKKHTADYEAPGDEGAALARHLLEQEQYESGIVPLCSQKESGLELSFDRSKIGEVLERLLPEDMIQWEHTSRQLSFTSVFTIDDVVEDEMPGQRVVAAESAGTLKKGDVVSVVAWVRQAKEILVSDAAGTTQTLPIHSFEPRRDPTSTLNYYSVGLNGLRKTIAANQASIQRYEAKKPAKPTTLWENERQRLIDLNEKRKRYYGQMLAREIMYNNFDGLFSRWVAHYNALLNPKENLDANVVKSMAFQEGRMGTSGRYFMKPPHSWAFTTAHPIMSRFNIIQALDSGLQQQFLIIEEMDSVFFNSEVMSDGRTMSSLKRLAAWKGLKFPDPSLVPPDVTLMQEAIEKFARKHAAIDGQVINGVSMGMYTDYNFSIRCAVRWLMEKYLVTVKSASWKSAVKRYNGGGSHAEKYAETVMKRIKDATGGVVNVGNR